MKENSSFTLGSTCYMISEEKIKSLCKKQAMPRLLLLEETESTNTLAKKLAEEEAIPDEGILIVAERQSAGRGRLGRSFLSDGRGLYLSYLFKPELPPEKIVRITTYSAVAMARAIDSLADTSTRIKWVNDLYLGGKKLAGILTEGGFEADGALKYAVVGIGVNLYCRNLPEELREIATDIEAQTGKQIDKNLLLARFIEEFRRSDILSPTAMEEYRNRSFILGKRVRVEAGEKSYEAIAEAINDDGNLIVKNDLGEIKTLFTGEVSIRPQEA